ncbi:L,D-transpeptidase catalytic domain [Methylobacterium phyllostachyos]|uniref:L,D-transpeptidase catalytic domain n=1 Tax=Methylobacterium phyllostachyos TaxID=582672 RepID=A0A1H0BML7_9HYPH|nr:L,D-transpeptidase [Methylobacterium phyllostachyos]SDN46910.1 L,D-transpeptidase catalytic domain [Methylobacterium phyllostachyos]
MRIGLVSVLSGLLLWAAVPASASADVLINVDKSAQRMEVTVDGQPRYSWPVSTGVESHDTPSGSYRPFRMERTHFSKEWDDAPMPFAMFFTNQGHAIHGTNHVRNLGRAASHGCVRLSVRNAATLFNLVKAEGMGRTRVVIEGADMPVAEAGPRGIRIARQRSPYGEALQADGDQMGRRSQSVTYRPAYVPAPAYGYPADTDEMDGW